MAYVGLKTEIVSFGLVIKLKIFFILPSIPDVIKI